MNKYDFGNWIPKRFLKRSYMRIAIIYILAFVSNHFSLKVLSLLFLMIGSAYLLFMIYMTICHYLFSYDGKKIMEKIHEYIISKLPKDLNGIAIDIGCGSGALAIKLKERYGDLDIIGIDYWGDEWDYKLKQSQNNAELAGFNIDFRKGDASDLEFDDDFFDLTISNFVFHEVKSVDDKNELIKEAIRVTKKGGYFLYHDLFENEKIYPDIERFLDELKRDVEEIIYIKNTERIIGLPSILLTPLMLSGLGLIYGKK
ncbi:MAG: class I SAM-dependent methyltransferase [Tissierellia bacterium]|nr:class I SAM-dependent methyltransferase [Tissierellia bacterium]